MPAEPTPFGVHCTIIASRIGRAPLINIHTHASVCVCVYIKQVHWRTSCPYNNNNNKREQSSGPDEIHTPLAVPCAVSLAHPSSLARMSSAVFGSFRRLMPMPEQRSSEMEIRSAWLAFNERASHEYVECD